MVAPCITVCVCVGQCVSCRSYCFQGYSILFLSTTVEKHTWTQFIGAKGPVQYVKRILKLITQAGLAVKITGDLFISFKEELSWSARNIIQADSSGIELHMPDCVYETNKDNKVLHFENEELIIQAFAIA